MNDIIPSLKNKINEIIDALKTELKGIRTGRAHTGMIENLQVEAYSSKMRLIELASITTEGNDALLITPFDPSTVQDIEKGIFASPIGVSPQTEGNRIIIRIPPLTEEQRTKYARLVSQIVEEAKNGIRRERDTIRKKVKALEDNKEISEDEQYRLEKEIDKESSDANDTLQALKEKKEEEIMAV